MDYIQEEDYEKEPPKKDKKILILIIVIILLVLIIAGILVYFLVIKKDNKKTSIPTTTTKPYDFKIPRNLSEYELMIKDEILDNESRELIIQDNSFKKIEIKKCSNKGIFKDNKDDHEIEYDCTYYIPNESYDYFVTIDNKFRFKEHSEYTCGLPLYYIGDNYVIYYLPSCAPGENKLIIYNQYQGESFKAGYDAPYVNTYEFYETNNKHYRPFIKDGYLFFLASQNTGDENNNSTCNVYRMNLSNTKLTYDLSSPFECNYGA